MANTKRSIKHYFILPSYQLRLVIFMSLIVFVGSLIHIAVLNYITNKNLTEHFTLDQINKIWEILQPSIILANSFSFIILTVFLIVLAVLISHKLIGPMLKITGHINKINSGCLPKNDLNLREGDEGQPLCDAVNKLRNNICLQYKELQKIKATTKDQETSLKLEKLLSELSIEK